jgi:hypothetical protein
VIGNYHYCKVYNNIFVDENTSTNYHYIMNLDHFDSADMSASSFYMDYNVYWRLNTGTYKTPGISWLSDPRTTGWGANSVNATPQFVSRTGNDFHINSTSPCKDAALITYISTFDYDLTTRPYDAGYDIGAYEYYSSSVYSSTVRTNGLDYFVWMGVNTSACYVKNNITGLNEATEYVALYNSTGGVGAWSIFYGDKTGTNWTVHTYDVIRTYMDDAAGTVTFLITGNPTMDFSDSRTVNLIKIGNGYNYTAYTTTATTLSVLNTTLSLPTGYSVAIWDGSGGGSTYTWMVWISGFGTMAGDDPTVWQYAVINTKIDADKVWVM